MCMKHVLNWRPGEYGKGLVHEGAVHTWGVGPNQDGSPTHPEYAQQFGLNESQYGDHKMFDTAFGINPEGALNVYDDSGWSSHPEKEGKVAAEAVAVDPRLYVPSDDKAATWSFLGVAKNDEKWQLVKMGMPVGEDYWRDWQQQPDSALYHATTQGRLESIMQHGLHPWDSEISGGHHYDFNEWLKPRPGHVYMAQTPVEAYSKGMDLVDRSKGEEPVVLRIDPAYLQAHSVNPDEDTMLPEGNSRPYPGYDSLGEMAEKMDYGTPYETEGQIGRGNAVAYRGVVPPEAISPGMLGDKYIQQGAKTVRQWVPSEWPHTASLIGAMRDGWGRFAVIAPWEPGQWGKGIYFPETGTMRTWSDDRTHPEVALEDENVAQGDGHHFIIRPNGTVKDQGAMNSNFESVEGDVPGLAEALHSLDPRLRLDKPSAWDFGPTEPMEEEPSSVSRGEDGGTIHDVQTSNDYAGGL